MNDRRLAGAPPGADVPGGVLRHAAHAIRDDAVVRNKAIYLALGVQRDGRRHLLGLWIEAPRAPSSG